MPRKSTCKCWSLLIVSTLVDLHKNWIYEFSGITSLRRYFTHYRSHDVEIRKLIGQRHGKLLNAPDLNKSHQDLLLPAAAGAGQVLGLSRLRCRQKRRRQYGQSHGRPGVREGGGRQAQVRSRPPSQAFHHRVRHWGSRVKPSDRFFPSKQTRASVSLRRRDCTSAQWWRRPSTGRRSCSAWATSSVKGHGKRVASAKTNSTGRSTRWRPPSFSSPRPRPPDHRHSARNRSRNEIPTSRWTTRTLNTTWSVRWYSSTRLGEIFQHFYLVERVTTTRFIAGNQKQDGFRWRGTWCSTWPLYRKQNCYPIDWALRS